jgi:hypothetical protein
MKLNIKIRFRNTDELEEEIDSIRSNIESILLESFNKIFELVKDDYEIEIVEIDSTLKEIAR